MLTALRFVAAFPFLFFVPGWLALGATLRFRERPRLPLVEGLLAAVALSLLVTVSAAHALAVAGAFTIGRLFLWVALFSALLAALGGLARGRFLRFSLQGGWARHVLPLALLAVLAWAYYPPARYLWGDADEGVYLVASVEIVEGGGTWFRDDLLARAPQRMRELNLGILVPGFYFESQEDRNPVVSHGFHYMPAFLAAMHAAGGLQASYAGPIFLMLLGLLGFHVLGARFGGPWVALLLTALLGINPATLWFSRISFSEVAAVGMFLAAFGLFAVGFPAPDAPPRPRALRQLYLVVAGALVAVVHIAKIEFIVVPVVMIAFSFVLWSLGLLDRITLAFPVSYAVGFLLAVWFAVTDHHVYFFAQLHNKLIYGPRTLWLVSGFFVAAALFGAVLFHFRKPIRRLALSLPVARLLLWGGGIAVLVGLYLHFLFPAQADWGEEPADRLNALQRWLAFPPDRLATGQRNWRELTFSALGLYLTPLGLLLGVAGLFALLRRRRFLPLVPILLLTLMHTVVILFISGKIDEAGHFHSPGRRFLCISIPGFLLAALLPWFVLPDRPRLRWAGRIFGCALALWLGASFARVSGHFVFYRPWVDTEQHLQRLSRLAPPNIVWVCSGVDDTAMRFTMPLRLWARQEVFLLSQWSKPTDVDYVLGQLEELGYRPIMITGREPTLPGVPPFEVAFQERLGARGRTILDFAETTVNQTRRWLPGKEDCLVWNYRIVLHGISAPGD